MVGLWNLLFGSAHKDAPSHRVVGDAEIGDRSYRFETLETREMLNADPLFLGGVYIEEDPGTDSTGGDTFEITFTGGAPGTKLNSVLINGDHDGLPTVGTNDMIFDTVQQPTPNLTDALGKGAASGFQIVQKIGDFDVVATVQDGSTQLLLTFTNFDAGDKLIFRIDVDEVNNIANGPIDGLDEVASGIEWHGSTLTGQFSAPGFYNTALTATYTDNFSFGGTPLVLSPNTAGATPENPAGKANRTAGGFNQLVQEELPIVISGRVYHDRDMDLTIDPSDTMLSGVTLELWKKVGDTFVDTGHRSITNATGDYRFGPELNLKPGTYQVREQQPADFKSVGAVPGTVSGVTSGQIVPGNKDVLTEITIPLGGTESIRNDFAEYKPVAIHGRVHLTTPDGDCYAPPGEVNVPLANVLIQLFDANGNFVMDTHTNANGEYSFVDLDPGTYKVVEHTPVGLLDSGDHVGTVNGTHVGQVTMNDTIAGITLMSGEVGVNYDFCESLPASLNGYVYHDRDNDGLKEAGEEGIPGTTVQLIVTRWNINGGPPVQEVIRTTTTNDVGFYQFLDLHTMKSGLEGDIMSVYSVVEIQPLGWRDGKDTAGTVGGATIGAAQNDIIKDLQLKYGEHGINYNFGELRPGSIAGTVHADPIRNCEVDEGEWMIEGVQIDLLDANGNVIATTFTDANGAYKFDNLDPGEYSVREHQPDGYFTGGQDAGHKIGDATVIGNEQTDLLTHILVGSGDELVNYDFCEVPPSEISGYVFIDGPDIRLAHGQSFSAADVPGLRDGLLTADDRRLAGAWLELRDGITGRVIDASEALPGMYPAGAIRVQTDENGYYHFGGLAAGNYAVFQVQPGGNLIDGLDTAGTQSGIAINVNSTVSPAVLSTLTVAHGNDAILRIALPPGVHSQQNNFSEVKVERPPIFFDPPPVFPPPPFAPPPPQLPPGVAPPPPVIDIPIPPVEPSGGALGYTWHLSVVDAGQPRQLQEVADVLVQTGTHLSYIAWNGALLSEASWQLGERGEGGDAERLTVRDHVFGLPGAIPVAGDFNGDGQSEAGVYYRGEWFIDLNGNGRWDEGDLWAQLGSFRDKPVVGDWDGDGKDDIGIFGPAWPGDPRAIELEPGLPDPQNPILDVVRQKNMPPKVHEATLGHRVMQLTSHGKVRADLIDHVFHYGTAGDIPIVGDWNGDGIDTIAIFRNGRWNLDMDGDGRWTEADKLAQFGQRGDLPVVGDWDGDGLDEIGIYRAGKWYLDTNRNFDLDATDAVYDLGSAGDLPAVGDWNGDGRDDLGTYRATGPVRDVQIRAG